MKQLLYTHLFLFIALLTVNQSFAQEDALFIDKSGNVGIGTSTPQQNFSVNGGLNIDQAANNNGTFTSASSAIQNVLSFGAASGEGIASNRKSVNENQYGLDFYTAFTKRMSISNSGNIGIGTTSPSSPLHIKTNVSQIMELETQEKDVYLRLTTNNNIGNWAIGTNEAGNGTDNNQFYIWNKYDIQNNKGNYAFTIQKQSGNVGIGTTSPTNKLSVEGNANFSGNVGIGTNNPTQGILVVKGNISTDIGEYGYLTKGRTVTANPWSGSKDYIEVSVEKASGGTPLSIYAERRIAAESFNAFSDSRIKKDFQKSDIAQDLETLRKLQITDYYYKDGLQHGFAQKKGIIAQEVEAVFPQAVNKHSDYISDIFAMPIHTNLVETTLTVSMEKEHGLKNGDKVRLITPNEVAEVEIAVMNDKSFIVKDWDKKTTEVFVYGKLVDDFRSVDFDRLTILSISGVQQLCKEMEAMKAELQQTKDLFSKELAELKKDMQSLDAKVSNTKASAAR